MDQILHTILTVGDGPSIRFVLRTILASRGYSVVEAELGTEALELLHAVHIDLMFLDADLPGMNSVTTCRRARQDFPHLPILMVSARADDEFLVQAFDAGADDYIRRPFHLREMLARVRMAIRRHSWPPAEQDMVMAGDLRLDAVGQLVEKQGRAIHLTRRQCEILRLMMTNCDKPMGHEELLTTIWGRDYANRLDYLRAFVRQIRILIEDDPSRPRYLLTEPHFGYRFTIPAGQG